MKKTYFYKMALLSLTILTGCSHKSIELGIREQIQTFQAEPDSVLAKKFSVMRDYTVHKPVSLKENDYPDAHFGFKSDEETLRRWLAWSYPNLDIFMMSPSHPYFTKYQQSLKEIALKLTFVIDYGPDIENLGGASAEDDPHFYEYPSTDFFHQQLEPQGKIRVIVTKYFIRTLQLVEAIEIDRKIFLPATRQRTQGFFAHELLHAAQYAKAPLRNVANFSDSIVNGVAPLWLYEDAFKKATVYEPEGFYMQHLFDKDLTKELEQYAHEVKAYKDKYPEQFLKGGRFEILGRHNYQGMGQQGKNVEFDLSMPGEIRVKKWKSPTFVGIMDGYHVPLKVVRDLSEISYKLQNKQMSVSTARKELSAVTQPWFALFKSAQHKYMDESDPIVSTIMARHPYHKKRGVIAQFDDLYRRIQSQVHR